MKAALAMSQHELTESFAHPAQQPAGPGTDGDPLADGRDGD